MKEYIIKGATKVVRNPDIRSVKENVVAEGPEEMIVSDGYHTMDELYDHRIALYIALCREIGCRWGQKNNVWRSKLHSDGTSFEGWFILGIYTEKGNQITYHLPLKNWDDTAFAQTRDKAPEFDGHTSADVMERIKNI